jgi:hypothetical protein
MAKSPVPFAIIVFFLLSGCQQSTTSMVDSLPAPNFSGPSFPDPAAPAPAPIVQAPQEPAPPIAAAPTPPPAAPRHVPVGVPSDWIPHAAPNQWYWVVIHHSATPTGGAAAFDKMHRAKGWDELGYHFVIGNGTDTRDGQIEVGSRWTKQKWGAHAKTPDNRYNEHGIGICLVGNFDVNRPSEAQIRSLTRLISFLMKTYRIAPDHVIGHRDTKSTDCPGRYVNVAQIRRMSVQMLAAAGDTTPEAMDSARVSSELLHEK